MTQYFESEIKEKRNLESSHLSEMNNQRSEAKIRFYDLVEKLYAYLL